MNKINTLKLTAAITAALCVGCFAWLLSTQSLNGSLAQGLKDEKLKSETLLSEKLWLEKDIDRFKKKLNELENVNNGLSSVVSSTSAKLRTTEAEYQNLKRKNASLPEIKKQQAKLRQLNFDLEQQLAASRSSQGLLEKENDEMRNSIALLKVENWQLTEELRKSLLASVDHTQLLALKRKAGKVTVRARQARELIANFVVPADARHLTFEVIDPSGSMLNKKEGTMAYRILNDSNAYTASLDAHPAIQQNVEMTFKPNKKLKPGVYRMEIYSEGVYTGSFQVKLR